MKKILSIVLTAAMLCTTALALSACGGSSSSDTSSQASSADTKTVASIDDLKGAKIGVQLGTTGDIYASDYEEEIGRASCRERV